MKKADEVGELIRQVEEIGENFVAMCQVKGYNPVAALIALISLTAGARDTLKNLDDSYGIPKDKIIQMIQEIEDRLK